MSGPLGWISGAAGSMGQMNSAGLPMQTRLDPQTPFSMLPVLHMLHAFLPGLDPIREAQHPGCLVASAGTSCSARLLSVVLLGS